MSNGRRLLLALCATSLAACGELLSEGTGDLAGIAGAGIAGAITDSAAAGAAIGLGVRSIADIGLRYGQRRIHGDGQDRIAEVAGTLRPGEVGAWSIAPDIPIEDAAHGRVTVSRAFGGPGFDCREIVFSVDDDADPPKPAFFTATVCQDGTTWKWATAEPSTARWGGLQ